MSQRNVPRAAAFCGSVVPSIFDGGTLRQLRTLGRGRLARMFGRQLDRGTWSHRTLDDRFPGFAIRPQKLHRVAVLASVDPNRALEDESSVWLRRHVLENGG